MKNVLLIFFLQASVTLLAQKVQLPEAITQSIEHRIKYATNPSIVIGIVDKDGPRYYSWGNSQTGSSPIDEHTLYEIGSITKVFTAILLADHIVKGTMSADDPVSQYLLSDVHIPSYNGQPIRLGQLSDHTSALPRLPDNMNPKDPANPYADYTVQQMYTFLSTHQLRRSPGSEYEYSNLGVGLLGHILSVQSGIPYEDLLRRTVLSPLRMSESGITLTPSMKQQIAAGHSMGIEVSNWDIPTLAGAGAIRSSVHDMVLFLSANLGLTQSTLEAALTLTHQTRHDKAGNNRVGLGWHIVNGSQGDILSHSGGTGGYRAFAGFVKETGTGVVVLTNSDAGVDDIGLHLLDPQSPLQKIKPQIASVLRQIIDTEGPAGLIEKYKMYKAKNPDDYEFNENTINALGYYYLGIRQMDAALELFKINVMEFPNSSNVYDSYGEALMKKGQKEEAILNYQKSLELNPGNTNAVDMLSEMGVETQVHELKLEETILETYTGTYELVPGFNIVITREDDRLFGQATGQSKFELFAKSPTEFFLKVVEASITFSTDENGETSMTLFQGGQVLPGKRKK